MVLVYLFSGGRVSNIVNNRTNHQLTSAIVVNFMNSARVYWIIKRTVFNVYFSLNRSGRYEHNQFERRDEKPRHQRNIFIFKCLLVAFINYTLLYTKL